ncbi:MAG: MBL fold metallo-hydrolase RNA specificity domain-containing protein [Dissulfurispiraceae bacterium]
MKITFLGGVRKVTGSCFHLLSDNRQFLVDCGMHQGEDADSINRASFPFNPEEIDCLFLTHAHIDHSGLMPKLPRDGFKGKILLTPATADLVQVLLHDSARLQEKDAEWLTKKSFRTGRDITFEPLYTADDVKALVPLFEMKKYGELTHLDKGLSYRFLDAGHILGSGSLEIWYRDRRVEKKIVFSGDIGKKNNPIINDPQTIRTADYVVVESTYGSRLHKSMDESTNELVDAIKTTLNGGGNVLIPSFAVGRTQDILYVLNNLVNEGKLSKLEVYIDSPLAEEATRIYLAHSEVFDEEAKRILKRGKESALKLHFIGSVEESMKINLIRSGAVIIAGSGMCEGGRITHHLKHNLWRHECSVLFVGFQAKGTLGRQIIEGARQVVVLGEKIAVRARVFTIGGFSAHADQKGLIDWLSAFTSRPEVFIVHGEENVSLEFEQTVRKTLGFVTHVPKNGEAFEI